MCGVAGFLDPQGAADPASADRLQRMLSTLVHRGPDDEGRWAEGPVALGHRRLSIVDLSPTGHQPMASSCGRYQIVFNGEIYNHASLRAELLERGCRFRGTSDTEVLLALVQGQGLVAALQRCVGMFAVALWDRQIQSLHLARDRMGEKPLYLARCGARFVFASELNALRVDPAFDDQLDPSSLRDLLQRGHLLADRSIFRGVRQLKPGYTMELRLERGRVQAGPELPFWSLDEVLHRGAATPFEGSLQEASEELERLLRQSTHLQMQADVAVGAFLSGGVDSSVVTALMQQLAPGRVKSYSIGFAEEAYNEAHHARRVAEHLGTAHQELLLTEQEAQRIVPELASLYAEPLADSSQIPTVALARMVRRDVTVALSGDGADELFGGYPKYLRGVALHHDPTRALKATATSAACATVLPVARWLLPGSVAARVPWHRVQTARQLYAARSAAQLADRLSMLNRDALELLSPAWRVALEQEPALPPEWDVSYERQAMRLDLQRYLPGDILVKVDRATMSASLESRAPMLDHRVVEFSATLRGPLLLGEGQGKHVLRHLLHRLVPRELVERPKAGFQAPVAHWLRAGLKSWADDVLASSAAAEVLDVERCRSLLQQHRSGAFDISARLWPVVTLAAWLQARSQAPAGASAP